jgi:hypothetical protein
MCAPVLQVANRGLVWLAAGAPGDEAPLESGVGQVQGYQKRSYLAFGQISAY